MRRPWILLVSLTACGGTDDSGSHIPEVGRYAFAAEWNHPDFPGDPAVVSGELEITAAGESSVNYSLTVQGETNTSTASWTELNDWLFISEGIGMAGIWVLLPHLKRFGSEYECYGNAFSQQFGGQVMTCSFEFLGD